MNIVPGSSSIPQVVALLFLLTSVEMEKGDHGTDIQTQNCSDQPKGERENKKVLLCLFLLGVCASEQSLLRHKAKLNALKMDTVSINGEKYLS